MEIKIHKAAAENSVRAHKDQTDEKKIKVDFVHWKPLSSVWSTMSVFAFVAALLINIIWPPIQNVNEVPYRSVIGFVGVLLIIAHIASIKNESLKVKLNHKSQFYFATGLTLAVWDILSTKTNILPLPFFPGPVQIVQVMSEDWQTLLTSTAYSLRLFFIGFTIGTALGILTGIIIGWYRQWHYWVFPILKVTGVIPAVAWIPIAMIVFPSSFTAGIFLIVISVWFSVAFMTSNGILGIQKSYFEAARTLGANERYLLFEVAIPGALPSIFTGISTATGLSFSTLVVSEMIGAKAGLGWYINWAKGWSVYSKVYGAIIIMAIAFSIILAVVGKIRGKLLIWQMGLVK